jgi:hypothetical protein
VGTDHRVSALTSAALIAALCLAVGCKRSPSPAAGASAAPSAPPVDRLGPGELPPGTEVIYGLVLPRGLALRGVFPEVAHAFGPLTLEDVSNYVRARVDVQRVELGAVGTVFPAVHLTGGDPSRLYRIEVNPRGLNTELVIRDVTPPPPPPPGLTDAERWKRAGYNPDGTPMNTRDLR